LSELIEKRQRKHSKVLKLYLALAHWKESTIIVIFTLNFFFIWHQENKSWY